MFKNITRVSVWVGFLALSAVLGFAQSGEALRVHVPFAFTVGSANLPAGDYVVQRESNSGIVTVQSVSGKSAAAAITSNGGSLGTQAPELVFVRRAGQVVLAEVRLRNQPVHVLPAGMIATAGR